jgi:hypothetical protein
MPPRTPPSHGAQLDDALSQLDGGSGFFTICGFGSLLSERSARSTLPGLKNFRKARIVDSSSFAYRRVFAHTADVFFERGIADAPTREVASLSIERVGNTTPTEPMVVTAFEAPYDSETIAAFVAREHEFRLVAVHLDDGSVAVACERFSDDEYVKTRFNGDRQAFEKRWGVIWQDGYGNKTVWHDESVLPCRLYFRHCVLAARKLGREEEDNFLRTTFLADRSTTAGEWLERLEKETNGEFLKNGGGGNKGVWHAALLERYGG